MLLGLWWLLLEQELNRTNKEDRKQLNRERQKSKSSLGIKASNECR